MQQRRNKASFRGKVIYLTFIKIAVLRTLSFIDYVIQTNQTNELKIMFKNFRKNFLVRSQARCIQAGDVLAPDNPWLLYAIPFGVLSMSLWGILFLSLVIPAIVIPPEMRSPSNWSPDFVEGLKFIVMSQASIFLFQILIPHFFLSKRRVEVFATHVRICGVFRERDVSIQGVVKITEVFDSAGLKSSFKLEYHASTDVTTISGWLLSDAAKKGLKNYIFQKNNLFKPEDGIQISF